MFLPDIYILPQPHLSYPKQGLSHCGAYCLHVILQATHRPTASHPENYYQDWFRRLTGSGFTRNYYPSLLHQQGLTPIWGNVRSNHLVFLRRTLSSGHPMMLLIGNGYFPNGTYSPLVASLQPHWIVLLGYHHSHRLFYIYDPCHTLPQSGLPIGNSTRTYSQVMRDWRGSILTRLFLGRGPYFYIYPQI